MEYIIPYEIEFEMYVLHNNRCKGPKGQIVPYETKCELYMLQRLIHSQLHIKDMRWVHTVDSSVMMCL